MVIGVIDVRLSRESEKATSWPRLRLKVSAIPRSHRPLVASGSTQHGHRRIKYCQAALNDTPGRREHRSASGRSARSPDLYKSVTQLHRERTEQVAALNAVAGLARPFKRGGDGANASRTHRLRGALKLVCGSGQLGKIAAARGNVDFTLCLDCCFTKFPQQRINGGAVLAEPSRKH